MSKTMGISNIKKTLLGLSLLGFSNIGFAQFAENCAALENFSNPLLNLEITSTSWDENRSAQTNPFAPPQTLPAHCHVEGVLDRRVGVDGVEYSIGFALNLPKNWTGRFMFQGGGGLNGAIGEPVGNVATGGISALAQGFAVVSTDSGHKGSNFDASFMADQEAALNFYLQANAKVTQLAKLLTNTFYDEMIKFSYFAGCSTGGREAMIMSQHYPSYYDGIISGNPAIRTGLSNLAGNWVAIQLNKAAEKDSNGLPVQGGTFNKAEQILIVDAVLESCDALDGLEDGLIFNSMACDFEPTEIACEAGQGSNNSCIDADKAAALEIAFSGPVDSRGIQVYPGFMYDAGIADPGFIAGLLVGNHNAPEGAPVNTVLEIDVDEIVLEVMKTDVAMGYSTALNLSSFQGNGGKIIYYHGNSDPWFSPLDSVGYYEQMASKNGGLEAINDWSKLYLVPGMGHCQGGSATLDNFNLLTELIDWVENDSAPEGIPATGMSMPGVSRPLCPYPSYAKYDGKGDVLRADSFTCEQ